MDSRAEASAAGPGARVFATTHWTLVRQAGADSTARAAALEQLCRTYWFPLFSFVRRRGLPAHDAEDLIQGFFAFLLEKKVLARADRGRGRFRTFLLTSLLHFQANERARAGARKRGGGTALVSFDEIQAETRYRSETASPASPETLYDQRWAVSLLEHVLQLLRRDYAAAGKAALFEDLRQVLWDGRAEESYAALALRHGMTEGAIKVAVHRLRLRFRQCLRDEVAHTVTDPAEVEDELRHLLAALSM